MAGGSFGGYLALRAAGGESRLAACIADPGLTGLWQTMQKMFAALPASALADPLSADPQLFAPYLAHINASPTMHWKVVQRAFWVHGVSSLAEYLAVGREYTTEIALSTIRCPVFLANEEDDPLAASAPEVYEALTAPKTLVRFLHTEGAGDHCAMMARSLFHQRMFDWLDEVLR